MSDELLPHAAPVFPCLEFYPEPGGAAVRVPLDHFPFRIGRCASADHTIYSRQVSKEHAEIDRNANEFVIRDVGSTNGTFVNGQRIDQSALLDGDIIHVSQQEFRFTCHAVQSTRDSIDNHLTDTGASQVPFSVIHDGEHLRELLIQHSVGIVFQPIVHLETGAVLGYEALGRGVHEELSPSPCDLFRLAEHCKLAPELSRLFRQVAIEDAALLPQEGLVFFNVHPTEMSKNLLLDSLAEMSSAFLASGRMVLEIHEDFGPDMATMRRLRNRLKELGIGLAYDDFGAGQARLRELTEAPPDFIKLDMSLIRGIDGAKARQELIEVFGRVSGDLGVRLIAEGIEMQDEADVCRRLGCMYGQGYLFGRPRPVADFASPTARQPSSIVA
jgi:EAL domain-containing protein (putative c-di-GMP-specific phosphodiesterase class I)